MRQNKKRGHDQFFTNVENNTDLNEVLSALYTILKAPLNKNLQRAYKAYLALEKNEDDEKAVETLEKCDDVFYENEGSINEILRQYSQTIEL